MNRRSFLRGAGTITVLVAAGGVWRAYDQHLLDVAEGPAYEPWKTWRSDQTPGPLSLVRSAILAASPHNTQPWLFRVTDNSIDVYADTQRNLGTFDPYLREMHIGLGCAVENMMLAATANGYSATATLFPGRLEPIPGKSERALIARISLWPSQRQPNALYEAIPHRHTNRGPYNLNRSLAPDSIRALAHLGTEPDIKLFLYTSAEDRKKAGDILVTATEYIVADKQMLDDSERWARFRWSDIQKFRDGLTIDCMGVPPRMAALAKILPPIPASVSGRLWVDQTREVDVATSPLLGLIAIRDLYDRPQNMHAGRLWQRIHLWATTLGIAARPTNQPMEVMDRERMLGKQPRQAQILADLTGDASWQPTFMFRMGYAKTSAPASPRRHVEDVVVT